VKILTDGAGNAATSRDRVLELLTRVEELLAQCNIIVCLRSIEFLEQPGLMSGVICGAGQIFTGAFSWLEKESCAGSPKPLTLFFVDSLENANACTIPRTSYVVLTDGANGASVVHELGHHADLFHRDDAQNIMFAEPSETKDQLTGWQCCMIRSSSFVNQMGYCLRVRSLSDRIRARHQSYRTDDG
jgi:hypothetical protein